MKLYNPNSKIDTALANAITNHPVIASTTLAVYMTGCAVAGYKIAKKISKKDSNDLILDFIEIDLP